MTAIPRYACARCNRRSPADDMIFSRFTRARYCNELNACAKRAKTNKRKETQA